MAQIVLAHSFELRCRNFPDFHVCCIFLTGLRIYVSLATVFGDLSLVSSPFLGIMIRRLLYVPDYVVSSLNNS